MRDGNEYGSIASLQSSQPDLIPEVRKALAEIEQIRGRPCICYAANVIKPVQDTAITTADHLPFQEMVAQVDTGARAVDVLLATPGGSAEQVNHFVDALRARFDDVQFLIPYMALSAGTLWALSGDRIWMDSRAFLGPIDPQVPSKDGRYVPAQSLLTLVNMIQQQSAAQVAKGMQPPWTHVVILKELDYRQLGAAISASQYSITMAAQFLEKYKFRSWTVHSSSGQPVTPTERAARARSVANDLCSHDRWKAHGHAITRDVLATELRIVVDRPETVPGLERAMRRLWALFYYIFDRASVAKILLSKQYSFVRTLAAVPRQP